MVIKKGLDDLKRMGVYVDEKLLEGWKAIGCRWVFEFKLQLPADAIHKARVIAQGFSQIPFVNYNSTFTPVAKAVSICFIAVYSALHSWHIHCFDATRAFLWGDLVRIIYMCCPPS